MDEREEGEGDKNGSSAIEAVPKGEKLEKSLPRGGSCSLVLEASEEAPDGPEMVGLGSKMRAARVTNCAWWYRIPPVWIISAI